VPPTVYEELGITPVINAAGPYTQFGGSLMPPEVVEAMRQAAQVFVDLDELLARAGEKIARLTGAEAALVTSGAAAGLAVCAAACMAGPDPLRAKQLPEVKEMKDEIIMLRVHRIHYDQAIRIAGARIVDVGFMDWSTVDDVEAAISDRTAGIFYVAKAEPLAGSVPLRQVVELAHRYGLPVVVDAADELPPPSNLHRFLDEGADAVIFSGGKDLRGPQSSGLILGRRSFVEACTYHTCPRYGIGRPMKVGKEEIVGLVKAVELYVRQDFNARLRFMQEAVDFFIEELSGLPKVRAQRYQPVPGDPGSFRLPAAHVEFDQAALRMTPREVADALLQGKPRVAVGTSSTGIVLRPQMLDPSQLPVVVERVRAILVP